MESPDRSAGYRHPFLCKLVEPGPYKITETLFLRLLGIIYLLAFASLVPQIPGLFGSRGIAPISRLLESLRAQNGGPALRYLPSLLWLDASDITLVAICVLGCAAGLLMVLGIFSRAATALCFVLYLSLVSAGQPFLSFQWDALLLESGFLAIFAGSAWLVWAYRFLLFRLMFESGWVKLASHDPNWRNGHALRFHFMTQPLPNPVSYYVAHWPASVLDALTFTTLVIEFLSPLLLFTPRVSRYVGVSLLALLQIVILLTGNYGFFNFLTLVLCIWALDDRTLSSFRPLLALRFPRWRDLPLIKTACNVAVGFLMVLGMTQLWQSITAAPIPLLTATLNFTQPYEIVNPYGLFAVMTTTRPEIVIEGSDDLNAWREYEFPYKPGNTHRVPPFVAPYQPRLDWQMWFAALGDYSSSNWVGGLLYRIATGEPSITKLLGPLPFAKPPRYLRAVVYQYNFTDARDRARTGAIWTRTRQGTWFGPVSLTGQ